MATQKKATKKTVKTPTKTAVKTPAPKTVEKSVKTVEKTPVQTPKNRDWKEILTRVVLVFETALLYFIILFVIFVMNNFTVMFFPKG